MRILHFVHNLSGGGAERQLSYLAPELVRMGHEVHIAYCNVGPQKPDFPDVNLHRLRYASNYDPYLLWQAVRLASHIKPDLIHTWILQMDIVGGLAAKLTNTCWILRESTHYMAYEPQTWRQRLRAWVGGYADAVVSISKGGDRYWADRIPHNRRYIVNHGLPASEIESVLPGLPSGLTMPEIPIVLYVGRLVSIKNVDFFLKAISFINRGEKRVLGVVCGDGPQRAELEAALDRSGEEGDIYFTGYLPDFSVWALMKKASVFVSLSAYEGGAPPNTVKEAMVCGCPLVLSNIPAHYENLDEEHALFVSPTNVQQISTAILKILNDPEGRKRQILKARTRSRDWTIALMAQNHERIYKKVMGLLIE